MPTTKTRLYTIEQLADELNLAESGTDLVSLFRHLHDAHDLERARVDAVLKYSAAETRQALNECRNTCKDGRQQRRHGIFDPDSSLLSSSTETPAERIIRLKRTHDLVSYSDMSQIPSRNGPWPKQSLTRALRVLGCQPHEPQAKPLLFKREDALRAIEALERDAGFRLQRSQRILQPKKKRAERLEETCRRRNWVLIRHAAIRYGVDHESNKACNNLSTKLGKYGVRPTTKIAGVNLYRWRDIDQAMTQAGYEAINPWPEWIE